MKTKTLIKFTLLTLTIVSCGKNKTGNLCKSRQQKVIECLRQYPYNHPAYVTRMCNDSYALERCYR